jgi:hypothetical protein
MKNLLRNDSPGNPDARLETVVTHCWDEILKQVAVIVQRGGRLTDVICVVDGRYGGPLLVNMLTTGLFDHAFAHVGVTVESPKPDHLRIVALFPDGVSTTTTWIDLPERFREASAS